MTTFKDHVVQAFTQAVDYGEDNIRLRAALLRYGLHTWDCAYNDSKGEQPCDCGWAAMEAELNAPR